MEVERGTAKRSESLSLPVILVSSPSSDRLLGKSFHDLAIHESNQTNHYNSQLVAMATELWSSMTTSPPRRKAEDDMSH